MESDDVDVADDELDDVECFGEIISADVESVSELEAGRALTTTILGCLKRPHLKK